MSSPVHTAARRLHGHLVATPLIGDLRLPGFDLSPQLRIKAECLQTAGSVWYRGYLHHLLQSLGRFKGLVLQGPPPVVLAQAWAGVLHRLPMVAVGPDLPAGVAALVRTMGVEFDPALAGAEVGSDEVEDRVAEVVRSTGFHRLPGAEEPGVGEGIASLGLELAAALPVDVARMVVADPALVPALSAGFAAGDRGCQVEVAAAEGPPPEWAEAVRQGLRLAPDPAALAALWAERATDRPSCILL